MKRTSWSRVGAEVNGHDVNEVLTQAGLNYKVVKEPIHMANGLELPGKFVTKMEGNENPKDVFGVVGSKYNIIQNAEAFDFINNLVDKEDLHFERAGQTYWGMVWMIASLPEYNLFGDHMKTYIIFQNSHNGGSLLKAAFCPLRMVCQNQFAIAFKKSKNSVSIRHTRSASDKLEEARGVMQATLGYTAEFTKLAEELRQIKLPKVKTDKVLELMFPFDEEIDGIRKQDRMKQNRAEVKHLFNNEDDLQNFRGTGWGLVNAFSDYVTHSEPTRKTENWEETKFVQTTQNTGSMDKLIKSVLAV